MTLGLDRIVDQAGNLVSGMLARVDSQIEDVLVIVAPGDRVLQTAVQLRSTASLN